LMINKINSILLCAIVTKQSISEIPVGLKQMGIKIVQCFITIRY